MIFHKYEYTFQEPHGPHARLVPWTLDCLCPGPRGERLRESVPVRRVRDDALAVDAEHVLRRDGGEQVDPDGRARVDVHVLLLAVERVQAVLAVVLPMQNPGERRVSELSTCVRIGAHLEEAVQAGTCTGRGRCGQPYV